jgi:hypothetical protein
MEADTIAIGHSQTEADLVGMRDVTESVQKNTKNENVAKEIEGIEQTKEIEPDKS